MPFRLHALDPRAFAPLFSLSEDALREREARRVIVDENPGYPCRVSLIDAAVGETVLLTQFEHQPARTPYRASHAIYVREAASQARPAIDEMPTAIESRLLSLRAFDSHHLLIDADVVDGTDAASALDELLGKAFVSYVHLHHARQGCFAALATRPRAFPTVGD